MSKLLTITFSGLSKSDRQKSISMDESIPIHITLSFNFLNSFYYTTNSNYFETTITTFCDKINS